MRDEMKITVIATGFDKEIAAVAAPGASVVQPPPPPRYTPRPPGDDIQTRPVAGQPRADDLDVPTFIRKKAD